MAEALDLIHAPWSWENPQTSLMWLLPPLQRLLAKGGFSEVTFHWCEWGHKWRKATTVKGRPPWLPQLLRRCDGQHDHVVLAGNVRHQGCAVSHTAAEYSPQWCRAYAQLQHSDVQRLG